MSSFERHKEKFELFKKDAENETISHPSRIEAYFSAAFQLIDACMAKNDLHINKHQKVRGVVTKEQHVFGDNAERLWRAFQLIENQIRPGQTYGGKIDGKELERTKNSFRIIEDICKKYF